jgi:hypothetical protein
MKTKYDDGLDWLRKIRRSMAEEFNHDPKKMGAHYRQMQRQYAARIYRREEHVTTAK